MKPSIISIIKLCSYCNKDKSVIEFFKQTTSKDGLSSVCKACTKLNNQKNRIKRRNTLSGYFNTALGKIRSRCKLHFIDRELSITLDDLIKQYAKQAGRCALTDKELTFITGKGRVHTNLSIDRIDSNRGYSVDNIQLVCDIVNMMKRNMTDNELYDWCKLIINNKKE